MEGRAARLQAAAASGEIVCASRVHNRAGEDAADGELRELAPKGKSEREVALPPSGSITLEVHRRGVTGSV